MTDLPMDPTEHPDEGLIHAWLDDALGAAEAERIAAHVRTCVDCQARVAEARGLIAGASRIVAALDDAPADSRPAWAQGALADGVVASGAAPSGGSPAAPAGSLWRWLRVTPGRAAAAATILVAIGITLTYERVAMDSAPGSMTSVLNPQKADMPAATSPEAGASDAAKPRDELLDSAMARNVEIAQGRRTMQAAGGPNVPAAPPSTTLQAPAGAAGQAVALGRASAEVARESAAIVPDRSRTAMTGAAASSRQPLRTTARPIERQQYGENEQMAGRPLPGVEEMSTVQAPRPLGSTADGAGLAKSSGNAVARSCFRLDSPDADARWADQSFPLVLAVEPGLAEEARDAAVVTPGGQTTQLRARWIPRGDSVRIVLRRIGYSGSIVLGPEAGTRSGVAVSATSELAAAVSAAPAPARERADARTESRKAVSAAPAAPQAAPAPGPPVRQLRVTARSIGCPAS